jgi:hypothetical protein
MRLASCFAVSTAASAASSPGLSVPVAPNGDFTVYVGAREWVSSSGVKLHADGAWASTADSTLLPVGSQTTSTGMDGIGAFTSHANAWKTSRAGTLIVTTVKQYASVVVFEQTFPNGVKGSALGPAKESKESVMSMYPSIELAPGSSKGFMAYYDQMVGGMVNGTKFGRWPAGPPPAATASDGAPFFPLLPGGTMGGPVALLGEGRLADDGGALVLGYAENFLSGQHVQDGAGALNFGLLGSITEVPANYTSAVMLSYSAEGVNAAMEGYGEALLRKHGKPGRQWDTAEDDISIQSLSYQTDNGAYYYYNTPDIDGQPQTYESTLLAVAAAAKAGGVPYRSVLLDSWWYFKVVLRTSTSNFNFGLLHFRDSLQLFNWCCRALRAA